MLTVYSLKLRRDKNLANEKKLWENLYQSYTCEKIVLLLNA